MIKKIALIVTLIVPVLAAGTTALFISFCRSHGRTLRSDIVHLDVRGNVSFRDARIIENKSGGSGKTREEKYRREPDHSRNTLAVQQHTCSNA
jgi:hypothetical protein